MINGLWSVDFHVLPSGTANNGSGVVVFKDGKIYGGDSTYYYTGTYQLNDKAFTAKVRIKHYSGLHNNIFGNVAEANVTLKGLADKNEFEASGSSDIQNQSIGMRVEKLEEI